MKRARAFSGCIRGDASDLRIGECFTDIDRPLSDVETIIQAGLVSKREDVRRRITDRQLIRSSFRARTSPE
jgi:hypothetical protein